VAIMTTADDIIHREQWGALTALLAGSSEHAKALVVEGEAGIGKTTFWLAALEHARAQGFTVLAARTAAAETRLAYAGLADLLAEVDESVLAHLPRPQRSALDRVLYPDVAVETPSNQRAVAAAFLAVVNGIAATSRALLAIDDLQWLDASSAAVVTFATRRVSGPVTILATIRTETHTAAADLIQLAAPDAVERVRLGPMALGELHRVISQRLCKRFRRSTMVRIHEVSGGNPFYGIELARGVESEATTDDIRLPATLAELVRPRIAVLSAGVRNLLLAAACLGEPTVELLAAAIGEDIDRLAPMLDEAENAGIVVVDGHRVRFAHPLLDRGVYTGAGSVRRRDMHRRLAAIVKEPELRARHLALGSTHGDNAIFESLDAAAEMARIRGAPAAAAELVELAIGLGADTSERRILLGRYLFSSGDAARARAELKAASGDAVGSLRAHARNLLGVMSQLEDSLLDAADEFALALRDIGDDTELRVRILISLSWVQVRIGQYEISARTVEDAVGHAERLGQPQLLSEALGMQTVVHFLIGDGLRNETLRRALELEGDSSEASAAVRPSFQNAMLLSWTGEFEAAHDQFAAVRQHCIEHGEESDLVFVSFHSVLNEVWGADYAHAAALADDTVERAQHLQGPLQLSAALIARGIVAAYTGRESDARRDIGEALEPVSGSGSGLLIGWALGILGFLEVSVGNYQAAITALEPLMDNLRAAPAATEIFVAGFVPDAAEALIQQGRVEEAETLITAVDRNGRRLDRPWMLVVAERCRAMLLAARGDIDEAGASIERAMVEHERVQMPFERARTQLVLGQIQRRQRGKRVASTTLQEASEMFEALGTPLWADRARAELARVKVGRQQSEVLSPSEQRVAELVASGLTNREVAAALFISPKTVDTNLGRIYRKLGIRSRAELGRHVGGLTSEPSG
jgi:DNA-binding CsgD family transcriptional regulator/tetratricopeptide (TPR) repeat protein